MRTGTYLGAGNPTGARAASYVAISCICKYQYLLPLSIPHFVSLLPVVTTLVPTTLYATLRYELPKMFTDDE